MSDRKLPDLRDLVVMLIEVAIGDTLQLLNMRPLIFDWWGLVALGPILIAVRHVLLIPAIPLADTKRP
jgi:hypothetical protein